METIEKINPQEQLSQELDNLSRDADIKTLVADVAVARGLEIPEYNEGIPEEMADAMRLVFNLRKPGGERTEREELPQKEQLTERIMRMAEKVGISGDSEPKDPKADAAIVLGGAGKSLIDRTSYIKELMDKGKLHTNTVALLGSSRPVNDAERQRAGAYADGATSEYDLAKNAAVNQFGVEFDEDEEFVGYEDAVSIGFEAGWRVSHAQTKNGINIFVISAPMLTEDRFYPDGNRRVRSNTADTYDMFARVAQLEDGARVVAATNAHFVPFQGADAVAELGKHGIDAEVVGFDPAHFGNPPKEPEELLQETLSAVNSKLRAIQG